MERKNEKEFYLFADNAYNEEEEPKIYAEKKRGLRFGGGRGRTSHEYFREPFFLRRSATQTAAAPCMFHAYQPTTASRREGSRQAFRCSRLVCLEAGITTARSSRRYNHNGFTSPPPRPRNPSPISGGLDCPLIKPRAQNDDDSAPTDRSYPCSESDNMEREILSVAEHLLQESFPRSPLGNTDVVSFSLVVTWGKGIGCVALSILELQYDVRVRRRPVWSSPAHNECTMHHSCNRPLK